MRDFNDKIVDSMHYVNLTLAGIFMMAAVLSFIDLINEDLVSALFAFITAIGAGILTCGFISLMLNINKNIEILAKKK